MRDTSAARVLFVTSWWSCWPGFAVATTRRIGVHAAFVVAWRSSAGGNGGRQLMNAFLARNMT